MYRLAEGILPVISVAVLICFMDWFDAFHLLAAAGVFVTVLTIALLFRRWRRGGLDDLADEVDPVEASSPGMLRGLLIGAAYGLVVTSIALGGVRALEATPLYPLWSDGDLKHLEARLQTLEDAGNHEEAARVIQTRLERPISSEARGRFAEQLYCCLVRAGEARRDADRLAQASDLLSRAIRVAQRYHLSAELAEVLAGGLEGEINFRSRLDSLGQSGKWAELLAAVDERLAAGGADDRWLVRLHIQALTRLGGEPAISVGDRVAYLERAIGEGRRHGKDVFEAQRELARLREQIRGHDHFAQQVAEFRRRGDLDQAAELLRLAIHQQPREHWAVPLDHLLYEILVSHARSLAEPAQQERKFAEAVEVANEFGLDGSVAQEALNILEAKRVLAQRTAELESARREAELSRKQSEEARLRLEQMLAQAAPQRLDDGAEAGLVRVDTRAHPVLLVDLWVSQANGAPYADLEEKDFLASFAGSPATVALAQVPAKSHKRALRLALLIDGSGSMKGQAVSEARKGAAQFVESLPAEAEVTVVQFGTSVQTLCDFTCDRHRIRQAIDGIQAGGRTAFYRALDVVGRRLAKTISSAGSAKEARFVVLLSDGRDNVGGRPVDELLAGYRQIGARVFAIGLKSADLDVQLLTRLASETGGAYLEASQAEQLAQQFRKAAVEVQRECYRLAVSVPAHVSHGRLVVTIGAGPHALSINEDVDCGREEQM